MAVMELRVACHQSSPPVTVMTINNNRRRRMCMAEDKRWLKQTSLCKCKPRIMCSQGSKEDAARKALEDAFAEKKSVFKKWDEEIKHREEKIGGGSNDAGSGGRGWGGGDESGDFDEGNESWEERIQVFLAVTGLIALYCFLTMGKGFFALILNMILFALRAALSGFKRRRRGSIYTDEATAVSRVRQKWGSN